ncbi:unnamed protein product [Amoebophrya sp. A25]|nr:unnamed protein product [Amoebophrya sp. A25]|eukprot:GSA25T00027188001.1
MREHCGSDGGFFDSLMVLFRKRELDADASVKLRTPVCFIEDGKLQREQGHWLTAQESRTRSYTESRSVPLDEKVGAAEDSLLAAVFPAPLSYDALDLHTVMEDYASARQEAMLAFQKGLTASKRPSLAADRNASASKSSHMTREHEGSEHADAEHAGAGGGGSDVNLSSMQTNLVHRQGFIEMSRTLRQALARSAVRSLLGGDHYRQGDHHDDDRGVQDDQNGTSAIQDAQDQSSLPLLKTDNRAIFWELRDPPRNKVDRPSGGNQSLTSTSRNEAELQQGGNENGEEQLNLNSTAAQEEPDNSDDLNTPSISETLNHLDGGSPSSSNMASHHYPAAVFLMILLKAFRRERASAVTVLSDSPLFRSLSKNQLEEIVSFSEVVNLEKRGNEEKEQLDQKEKPGDAHDQRTVFHLQDDLTLTTLLQEQGENLNHQLRAENITQRPSTSTFVVLAGEVEVLKVESGCGTQEGATTAAANEQQSSSETLRVGGYLNELPLLLPLDTRIDVIPADQSYTSAVAVKLESETATLLRIPTAKFVSRLGTLHQALSGEIRGGGGGDDREG